MQSPASRDGERVVVSGDNKKAVKALGIAPCLRIAVENWKESKPRLETLCEQLNSGDVRDCFRVDQERFHSPLPRSFQWADGSAFLHHVKLVRMARNEPLPQILLTVPLMYQGGSDCSLAPRKGIPQVDFTHGTDFERKGGVILDDVPMGVSAEDALTDLRQLKK